MFDDYADWFKALQDDICTTVEEVDWFGGNMVEHEGSTKEGWTQMHKTIRGDVFEKGTVNFSKIVSEFDPKFAKEIPGTEEHNRYSATGISVVLHPRNPHVPAMHFNTRYLKTSTKEWFGGGMDVTPCMSFDTDTYHSKLKDMCDKHDETYYPKFSKACDEYFFIPHRNETRGVGGLFFEYHDPSDMSFDFVKDVGVLFNELVKSTVRELCDTSYTDEDRETLEVKRGRYVEFNLLYDRGTRFGFKTGGNMDAILMTLPPTVRWK
tara:strand:+ start:507 stop:1301 length:795 start_codon:yes stop_codon:yes gene_type:complete